MKRGLIWSGAALLLLAAACGGSDNNNSRAAKLAASATAGAAGNVTATAGAVRTFPGDPPATAETARIDKMMAAITFPSNVDVAGRKDIPNDAPDYKDTPDVVKRFQDYGRQTGNYYVLAVNGTPRLTLAVSQYAQPEGAKKELDFGRGTSKPEDRIDASGIGDNVSAFRVRLPSSGGTAPAPIVVSFTRGRYYVVVADTAAVADSPPDTVLEIARAVDNQLKANPAP